MSLGKINVNEGNEIHYDMILVVYPLLRFNSETDTCRLSVSESIFDLIRSFHFFHCSNN